MRILLTIILLIACYCCDAQVKIATASVKDFYPVLGELKGSLTYKDYSSGKAFTMPVEMRLVKSPTVDTELVEIIRYPEEPKANGQDTIRFNRAGTLVDGEPLIEKKQLADGSLQLTTESKGVDGNDHKPARIRHYYIIGNGKYTTRKEVLFEGQQEWIVRNVYSFTRS